MTILEEAPVLPRLDFGIYDADEHYYEPQDCVHRHLPSEFRHALRWVDIDRRRTLLINGRLLSVIPNPTYDPVGAPGSLEVYFRSANHEGRELRDMVKMQPIQPEYRDRDARIAAMDRQGVDFTWLLPSLGLSLEEPLADDPAALNAVFTSYNRWLEDDWGYDRDGRIQTGPMITLVDPVAAEAEVDRVLKLGARFVTMRPAPTRSRGVSRSIGDRSHDRVWARLAEAGCVVSMHAADSGYGRTLVDWGEADQFSGIKLSPLAEVLSVHIERPIYDTIAAMICHGVFDRHPTLRVASLELGAGWVQPLVRRLRASFGKSPQAFGRRDPVETFREHVWVAPFYEDDIAFVADSIGVDRIMLGSDWPHPEGLPSPAACLADFEALGPSGVRMALRDNLRNLTGR